MPKSKISEEVWVELVEFYSLGHTFTECQVKFGVSPASISRYFKQNNIPSRPRFEKARPDKALNPELRRSPRVEENTPPPGVSSTRKRKVVKLHG